MRCLAALGFCHVLDHGGLRHLCDIGTPKQALAAAHHALLRLAAWLRQAMILLANIVGSPFRPHTRTFPTAPRFQTAARALLDTLTPREFEVMQRVIAGMLNKQIADELGAAEKTIKIHRGRVMEKMAVISVAELVRVAQTAGVAPVAVSA